MSYQRRPHEVSGVLACDATSTFSDLVDAAEAAGWSVDGYQPEPSEATIAELLERRQPRPIHWSCGLLPAHLSRVTARTRDGAEYTSRAAPRRASGPDFAYLFVGGEGHFGRIEMAELNLLRPVPSYVFGRAVFDTLEQLFSALRAVALDDPASTRAVNLEEKRVECYSPVRDGDSDLLAGLFTEQGFEVEEVLEVPRESRFRAPFCDTPALMISGAFSALERLIPEVLARRGRRKMTMRMDYPDIHGALLRVEVANSGAEFIKGLSSNTLVLKGVDGIWPVGIPLQRETDFEQVFGDQELGK